MEGDSNTEEYLVISITGETDISLFDALALTFFDREAIGMIYFYENCNISV